MGTIRISLGYDTELGYDDEGYGPWPPGLNIKPARSTSAVTAGDEDYGPWPWPPGIELPKPPEPSTWHYGRKIIGSFLIGLFLGCFPVFGILILFLFPFWNDWGESVAYVVVIAIAVWYCIRMVKDDVEHWRDVIGEHVRREKEVEDQWNALVEEAERGDNSKFPTSANGYVLDMPPEVELLDKPICFEGKDDLGLEDLGHTYGAGEVSGGDWGVAATDEEAAVAVGRKPRKISSSWDKTEEIEVTKHSDVEGIVCGAHVRMSTNKKNPACPADCWEDLTTAEFEVLLGRSVSAPAFVDGATEFGSWVWTAVHIRGHSYPPEQVPGEWKNLEDAVDAVVLMRKCAEAGGARKRRIQILN